ncbi:MFS transporter [Nitrincola sp. MINF-07-Sa-05]|uniref:MFS transporter n=1 Tax=Nitrincola salilacus TaxID=3400273 RepID=UPI003917BC2D
MMTTKLNPWWIVMAAAVVLAYSMGVRLALGLLVPDISQGLGVTVSELSLGFAIQNLIWGAVSPVAGALAERYGTAKVLLFGAFLYFAGLVAAAVAQSGALFFIGNALLIGVGVGATTFPIVLAAVGKRFPANKRTLALGVASAGGSLGQFLYALVLGYYAPSQGWANTFMLFASTTVLILAMIWLLRDQAKPAPDKDAPPLRIFDWQAIGQAMKLREYQLLNIGFFVCGFHIAFISVHMAGLVAYCGLLPGVAADSLALIGLMNIIGVIVVGWAGDRWHKPWLLVWIYGLRGCLILMLLMVPITDQVLYLFSGIMGMLWLSTVPLTSGAIAQLFGTKNLASLFGIVMFSHQIGAFFGSWWAGLTFEWYGSYDVALIASALLAMLAAVVHLPMTPRRMEKLAYREQAA